MRRRRRAAAASGSAPDRSRASGGSAWSRWGPSARTTSTRPLTARTSGCCTNAIVSRRRSPPLMRHALPRDVLRRVASPTLGPPNGQPVPVAMSTPSPRRRDCVRVCSSIDTHAGGQVRDELLLGAAHAIDRRDLDAAEPDALVRLEVPREVGGVHRAAVPPPARPRARLRGDGRPRGRLGDDRLRARRRLRGRRRLRAHCRLRAQHRRVREHGSERDERRRDARRVRSLVHGRGHRRGRVVRGAGSPQLGHVLIGRAGTGVPPGVVVGAVAAFTASIESARAAMSMRAREVRSGSSLAR